METQGTELLNNSSEMKVLKQKLKETTERCRLVEDQLTESQATVQLSETSQLQMKSLIQSMTEEISILQSCKDRLMAECEGSSEQKQEMSEQISKMCEEKKIYQETLILRDRELDELRNCFYQLKSFETEIVRQSSQRRKKAHKQSKSSVRTDDVEQSDGSVADSLTADQDTSHNGASQQNYDAAAVDRMLSDDDEGGDDYDSDDVDESEVNELQEALQQKLQSMMDVAHVGAKVQALEGENLSLQKTLMTEMENRLELEEHLKAAQAEIERLTDSRQKAELQISDTKLRMDMLSNIFKDRERELMSKLNAKEALEKQHSDKLGNSDERTKMLEAKVQLYEEQVNDCKREIGQLETDFKRQISVQEKKAHENWLAARQSERQLKEQKAEAQLLRQKLLDVQSKLDSLSQATSPIPPAASTALDESASTSSVPPVNLPPSDRRPFGYPLHDGFMIRPPLPPPFFPGHPMMPMSDRTLPPRLLDMRHTPPIPSPMFDMRFSRPPLPFDHWRGPPGYRGRSPSPVDRYSPVDRSPSSAHSPLPARGSSPTFRGQRSSPSGYQRGRPTSPPELVDRGPPHLARPRPELAMPPANARGPAIRSQPTRNDRSAREFMSSSPA